jgi:cytochrome c553
MQHFVNRHHLETPQAIADVASYVSSLPPREPTSAGPSARVMHGGTVFASLCASCHGRDAEGNPTARVPRLAAQHPEYLAEQLHDAVEGRRPSMGRDHARLLMRMNPDEIDAIAEYLAGIAPVARRTSALEP